MKILSNKTVPLLWQRLSSQSGPPKIGLIDLQKVFDHYYKTELANASIQDEAAGLEKDKQDPHRGLPQGH